MTSESWRSACKSDEMGVLSQINGNEKILYTLPYHDSKSSVHRYIPVLKPSR